LTKQVPEVVAVIVAVDPESDKEHDVAVPPAKIAKVTAPEPLVPLVVMLSCCEYGYVLDEVPSEVKVIDWVTRAICEEANEVAAVDPPLFVAVTVIFKYQPRSPVTIV
jgi:hypothetical protein